jgi:hypothetical protein
LQGTKVCKQSLQLIGTSLHRRARSLVAALLFDPRVLGQMAIYMAVAALAAAAPAWVGNPLYFRTFRARWLCWFALYLPGLLWGWVRVAEHYRN